MPTFQIRANLGGGFGGVENVDWETIEARDLQDANDQAYSRAIEVYESCEDLHGIRSLSTIMEEDGVDQEEAESIFKDEREGWLDYEARPFQGGDE